MKLFGRGTLAIACCAGVVGFAIVQARSARAENPPTDQTQQAAPAAAPAAPAQQGSAPPSDSLAAAMDKKPAEPAKAATNADELQNQLDRAKKERDEARKELAAADAERACSGVVEVQKCLLKVATAHIGTAAGTRAQAVLDKQLDKPVADKPETFNLVRIPVVIDACRQDAPTQVSLPTPAPKPSRVINKVPPRLAAKPNKCGGIF